MHKIRNVLYYIRDDNNHLIGFRYNEAVFEKLENHLLENKIINEKYDIYLTTIICVNRVTKYFSKYTEKNVIQERERYILPIGISFGSNTLYIATQKEGLYKWNYKN